MRIAHLLAHAGLNGVATSTFTLIEAQLAAGHEIMLVHPSPSWIEKQQFSRPIVKMVSDLPTRISEIRRVGYRIQDWGEDVLHTHGSRANKFGMIYRCIARTPTVMTAHARLFQLPWRFAHAVIAPSQPTADYYRKRFLVSDSRVDVVPHLFNVASVAQVTDDSRARARAGLGIRADAFLIGSLGEICDRKNQLDMLRLLKVLVSKGTDAELLLIGRKIPLTDDENWAELIADPQIADRIHLAGQRDDATSLLHAMDVYVCTSRIEEGPIATLEAMACGLPVLTADVGYSSELIENGRNGSLFPVGSVDAIADALGPLSIDVAARASIGRLGRQAIADKLTAAQIIPRMDAVYRAAIVRSRRRPRR